jgi:MoxR-like ATPase
MAKEHNDKATADQQQNKPAPRPAADPGDGKRDPNAAPEFSSTAVAERTADSVRAAAQRDADAPDAPKDRKAAAAADAKLEKEYEDTLRTIRETADPLARAQLVVKKGNITRQRDAIRRPHRLP